MESKNGIFEQDLSVAAYMVDNQVLMTPVCLTGVLQETAAAHCGEFKLSGIDLKPLNLFWVLTRMHVQIKRFPHWHEKIRIQTWEKSHSYISQPRDFLIIDEQGDTIVRASSIWAIINGQSKPQKLEDFDWEGRFPLEENAVTTKAFPRMAAAPKPDLPVVHQVLHSDIDLNEHVNNTKYLQWVLDEMGHDFCTRHQPTEISIHFISQLFPGDKYYIGKQEQSDGSWLMTVFAADDDREICRFWMKF